MVDQQGLVYLPAPAIVDKAVLTAAQEAIVLGLPTETSARGVEPIMVTLSQA